MASKATATPSATAGGRPPFPYPSGISIPDFNAQSRQPEILAGSIVPLCLASVFVIARFYTRLRLTRVWRGDDTWLLISWILAMMLIFLNIYSIHFGTGLHITAQLSANEMYGQALGFALRVVYRLVVATTKIGILTTFLGVFSDWRSRITIFCFMGFIVAYTIALELMTIFQCHPVEAAWNRAKQTGDNCLVLNTGVYVTAAFNISMDLAMVAFVVPKILPLQLPVRQKMLLLTVVSLSILVVVATVVRLVEIYGMRNSIDYSWDASDIATWSAIEVDTGLFCAAAPALRPLFRLLFPCWSSHGSKSPSDTGPYYGCSGRQIRTFGSSGHKCRHELKDVGSVGENTRRNHFWVGNAGRCEDLEGMEELSDGDSTKGVLREERRVEGAITKTVVVRISSEQRDERWGGGRV